MLKTLPLVGQRILVTRSRHQAGQLSSKLALLGAEPIEIPMLEIGPPDSWEPLDTALDQISQYHWILFASVNAVDALTDRLELFGRSVSELEHVKLAAIGPATADELLVRGLTATFRPSKFIAEALVEQFPGYPNLKSKKILWPRTNVGRGYIFDKLTEAGAQIDVIPAYKTSDPEDAAKAGQRVLNLLKDHQIDVITLASAQSATNLGRFLAQSQANSNGGTPNPPVARLLSTVKIATIGPETSNAALKALGKLDIEASIYTITGMVEAIARHFQEKNR